jgi:hypothetical protein
MYDIVYDFIIDTFLDTAGPIPQYYNSLALLLTHVTMILFYIALVSLIVHVFNAFRTMTRWW